jgi:hypothetical protein
MLQRLILLLLILIFCSLYGLLTIVAARNLSLNRPYRITVIIAMPESAKHCRPLTRFALY